MTLKSLTAALLAAAALSTAAYAGSLTPRSKLLGDGVMVIDHMNQLTDAITYATGN